MFVAVLEEGENMSLSYGMIADRLSDLVAEISEYNGETTDYHKASEMARIIGELDDVRAKCGEMLISCKPCAFRKQQLFGCVVLNTLEHGVCQFCGEEN